MAFPPPPPPPPFGVVEPFRELPRSRQKNRCHFGPSERGIGYSCSQMQESNLRAANPVARPGANRYFQCAPILCDAKLSACGISHCCDTRIGFYPRTVFSQLRGGSWFLGITAKYRERARNESVENPQGRTRARKPLEASGFETLLTLNEILRRSGFCGRTFKKHADRCPCVNPALKTRLASPSRVIPLNYTVPS